MKVVVLQKPMGVMGAKGPGQPEPVSSVGPVGTGEISNVPARRPTNRSTGMLSTAFFVVV
jgi:hypothetical protein